MWITIDDFTSGEASNFRRHTLTVAEGVLERHFEKLTYSSGDLFVLTQKPFPKHHSPLFNHNRHNMLPVSQLSSELYHQPFVNMIPAQVSALSVTPLSCAPPEFPMNSDIQYQPTNEHNSNVMDVMLTHSANNVQPVIVWDEAQVGHAEEFQELVSADTANVYTRTEEYQEPESLYLNEGVYTQTEEYQEPELDDFVLEDAGYNHYNQESLISPVQMDNSLQNYELVNDGGHSYTWDPSSLMAPSNFSGIDVGNFVLNYGIVDHDILSPPVDMQINEETWHNSDFN